MHSEYLGPLDEDLNRSVKNQHDAGEFLDGDTASDEILKLKIEKALWGHVELNSQAVKVHVKEGFVSLTGLADGEESKETIRAIVENIEGVQDVVNYLEIDDGQTSGVKDYQVSKPHAH